MTKYFLIAATADHVAKGVSEGFAQAGHGRKDLISKPAKGDWIVYYSAKDLFDHGKPLQQFTAVGQVTDEEPYTPPGKADFHPYRRNVHYQQIRAADIRPLIPKLAFIQNKKRWGFYIMGGFRTISKDDFDLIHQAMQLH